LHSQCCIEVKHKKKAALLKERQSKQSSVNQTSTSQGPKHVVNLSSKILDANEENILSKGLSFVVAPRKIPKEEIISNIEVNTRHLPEIGKLEIRYELMKAMKKSCFPSNISKEEHMALRKLKENKDVTILKSDKGNATVVMDKAEYEKKVFEILKDEAYVNVNRNPVNSLNKKLSALVKKCVPEYKALLPSVYRLPEMYGLPKIHKTGIPLRPIVAAIGSPGHLISKALAKLISPLVGNNGYTAKNSTDFINKVKEVKLSRNDVLVSFDVVSLFTRVPVEESLTILEEKMGESHMENSNNIIQVLSFLLKNTFFQFKTHIYKQREGMAMGNPLSPILANLFMEYIEERIMKDFSLKPKFWIRYVDDVFLIWPHGLEELENFFDSANNLFPSIKFTKELETNNELAFLDVLVKKTAENQLSFEVYRKATHTDQYINGNSHHHKKHKMAIWSTLIHRALNVCSTPELLNKELAHIAKVATDNGHIINVVKILKNIKKNLNSIKLKPHGPQKKKICVPYISGMYESIEKALQRWGIDTIPMPGRKIGSYLASNKIQKEALESPGVYSIDCANCNQQYVGQTKRMIKKRISEHKKNVKYGETDKSAVASHCWNKSHCMNWKSVKKIAPYSGYSSTLFREAVEISKTRNSMNNNFGNITLPNVWKEYFKNSPQSSM